MKTLTANSIWASQPSSSNRRKLPRWTKVIDDSIVYYTVLLTRFMPLKQDKVLIIGNSDL